MTWTVSLTIEVEGSPGIDADKAARLGLLALWAGQQPATISARPSTAHLPAPAVSVDDLLAGASSIVTAPNPWDRPPSYD